MDYIVNVPDIGEITIDTIDVEEAKKQSDRRLLTYYVAMMAPKIKSNLSNADKINLLIKIAGTLDEDEIKARMIQSSDDKKKANLVDVLQELVDAYEDEDLEQCIDKEINGNVFTYDKNLDVTPYLELFESIGKDTQGKRWRVEIDSEGKVVLHE